MIRDALQWVPVEGQLPAVGRRVLAWSLTGEVIAATVYGPDDAPKWLDDELRIRDVTHWRPLPPGPEEVERCDHSIATPTFDERAAEGLSSSEIRKRWPRFMGSCPSCGEPVILYASLSHFLEGDW